MNDGVTRSERTLAWAALGRVDLEDGLRCSTSLEDNRADGRVGLS